ncbi:helix-turn-helix domain-containing protein [Priestia sp. OVL9]|nr:helix-turn-helix domain-containing protein [Priestia sp. OVL9]MCJ7983655.1 helix-turn-helix domain-containing protein [Priestia sp. OVL9]
MKLDIDVNDLPVYKQLVVKRLFDGLSQKQLAEKLGIPKGTLGRIEMGRFEIPHKFYVQVIDYLFGGLK